ncbi:MAG TPA: Bax inhibitor-1/YccA family protein [Xanthobacteraceae bacterium]|nr:Bax inhibitor-1/YccA family protein [Xanthobacteraceae bacterium]
MSNFDRNYTAPSSRWGDRSVAIDAGLRAHMIRVYNYMAAGVALTGVVAWLTFQAAVTAGPGGRLVLTSFGQTIFGGPVTILLVLATLGLVFFINFRIQYLSASTALMLFLLYAGLLGLMLSTIFLQYTHTSITRIFFISAASFGGLSLWGYTTQRDLTPLGSFLGMGLIGLLLVMLVNFFIHSSGLEFVFSVAGVLIFAGFTAYDTQMIKELYDPMDDGTVGGRKAVMGALRLYLDFINLFIFLLRLFGDRR